MAADNSGISSAQKKMLYTAIVSALIAVLTTVTNSLTQKDPEVAASAVTGATVAPYAIRVGQQVQRLTETVNQLNSAVALLQAEQTKQYVQIELWKLSLAQTPTSTPHSTRPRPTPPAPASAPAAALPMIAPPPPARPPVPTFEAVVSPDALMGQYQLRPQQRQALQQAQQVQQQQQQSQE
jgi:hypothetical protein